MMPTESPIDRSSPTSWARLRPLLFALGAAALYGAWAFRANLPSGVPAALRATLTQAVLSFATTGGMSVLIEKLFRLGRTPAQGFWLAALGASAIAVSATIAIHALAGTPHILMTVAPTNVIGTTFGFVYAWGLRMGTRRAR